MAGFWIRGVRVLFYYKIIKYYFKKAGGIKLDIEKIFEKFPSIETHRLNLIELKEEYDKDLFKFFSDKKVMQYYDIDPLETIDDARKQINKFIDKYKNGLTIRWGISLKEEDKIIGTCGYHNWVKGYFRAEIGYELSSDYWQKGIMTEALVKVISFGFTEMNLNRIQALVYPENTASLELLKKCGFEEEGLLKEYAFFRGEFRDLIILSLLKNEYMKD